MIEIQIPMCRGEISRAHSALVGTAVRLAECIGLHRDPEEYGIGPLEAHSRRTLWYQICFLDLRTSETHGPRQAIRRDQFSTKFPLNVDDSDFQQPGSIVLDDRPQWTDMTFTRLRFECIELLRILNADRARLQKGSTSLTHILRKIEAFRKATYDKYGAMIYVPDQKPIQRAAHLMLSIFLCRAHVSVLHIFLYDPTVCVPDRLRQVALSTALQLAEDGMELDIAPDLQAWRWYTGAYHQYQSTLFLLVDVIVHPRCEEADRIWRCLDYVFETTALYSSERFETNGEKILAHRAYKASYILQQIRDRLEAFREMRKPRVSVKMRLAPVLKEPAPEPAASSRFESHEYRRVPSPGPVVDLLQQDQYASASTLLYPDFTTAAHTQSHPYETAMGLQNITQEPQDQIPQNIGQSHQDLQVGQDYPGATQSFQSDYPSYQQNAPFQAQYEPIAYLPNMHILRGQSTGSETMSSDDSNMGGLWFMSSTNTGGAGVASPLPAGAALSTQTSSSRADGSENRPMLDIDWVSVLVDILLNI